MNKRWIYPAVFLIPFFLVVTRGFAQFIGTNHHAMRRSHFSHWQSMASTDFRMDMRPFRGQSTRLSLTRGSFRYLKVALVHKSGLMWWLQNLIKSTSSSGFLKAFEVIATHEIEFLPEVA